MNSGEIWLVKLEPSIGAEISKTRPSIIVSGDEMGILPLKVIVPITNWKSQYSVRPWMVKLLPDATNMLRKLSAADIFQIRSVSMRRFSMQIGTVNIDTMQHIKKALKIVLDIDSY